MKIKKYLKPVMFAVGASTLTGTVGLFKYYEELHRDNLMISVIDLKFGHALFVRTPEDKRILINGGYNNEILNKIAQYLPFYSRRIDTIIATDIDKNSLGGLIPILERYLVSNVYIPKYSLSNLAISSSTDETADTFFKTLYGSSYIQTNKLKSGDRIKLSDSVSMDILFPLEPSKFKYSKSSPPKLLFNITYGDHVVTFIDNVGSKIQNLLAYNWLESHSDILIYTDGNKPGAVTKLLSQNLNPDYLIYSQKPKNTSEQKQNSKKRLQKDYIDYIREDHRFNFNDKTIKINLTKEKITISE